MKKILSFLLCFTLLFVWVEVKAQTAFSQTVSNPTGTITNTSIDTVTYTLKKSYSLVSVQPVVTKATGTMAGWSVLDYSVNGTNWHVGTDTLTLANQTTNTIVWNKESAARYWRVRTGGATTVTGTATAKISVSQ